MLLNDVIFIIILIVTVIISVLAQKLTYTAAAAASMIAIFVYEGTGFPGIALLGAFFIPAVLATSWKKNLKAQRDTAENNNGKRNARQVFANGGIAGVLGLLAWIFPEYHVLMLLMMACSLSSATADTLSSELGTVYGNKFYNILTLQKDLQGNNGVISAEGTLCGIAGSVLIAAVYSITSGWYTFTFLTIILAGTAGNLADSVLGATLENKGLIGNNMVNLLNTLISAVIGGLFLIILEM